MQSSMLPLKIRLPPRSPASGPNSTTQSHALSAASSCSTSKTVFPFDFKQPRASISILSSEGWRPIVGSSRTYVTPVKSIPSCVARRARWASPPESVEASRSRLMYDSPTLSKKPSLSLNPVKASFTGSYFFISKSLFTKARALSTLIAQNLS